MILKKKNKAMVAAILATAVTASSMVPCVASAAGTRTKAEAYGDSTYAERFLSLYDDVVTKGEENGYLSSTNDGGSGSFGVPYHSVETMIVEAPDYGHETTSEAVSYLVWVAAMRDKIASTGTVEGATNTNDLVKAWKTMEVLVPETQTSFWNQSQLSAQYAPEYETPEQYPAAQDSSNTGVNPLYNSFKSAYGNDDGLYLLHWLADVDDWYGYGGRFDNGSSSATGDFTFINTFQRGEQESCWETVPHPSVEELKYGNSQKGIKGVFTYDNVAKQYAYTNAPDAEDRAIQAIYAANLWEVGNTDLTAKAGKMGDQLRNNMFDKYYKAIGCQNYQTDTNGGSGLKGQHFLMSWYTSWGGDLGGQWAWQIGASHIHEFYQNPLAAYGLLYDNGLNQGMKSANATSDYEKSFARQIEMYLWLQSADGPIAGGCTNSYLGRYEKYPSDQPTFYDMVYLEHPVYADPGSNHWIGNQVWAMQRLAELYYYVQENGDKYGQKIAGLTLEEALSTILDRWVNWFVENVELTADGDFSIPATLNWSGTPATWTGTYDANANSGLTCSIDAVGQADLGCVSSLANTLIYYAAAKGTATDAGYSDANTELGGKALYLAKELLDREWEIARDDIGLSRADRNENFVRLFEQEVSVPSSYTGTMPNGDAIKTGIKFIDIRTEYEKDPMYATLLADYEDNGKTDTTTFTYHRFWHAGDVMMALGAMSLLYPDMKIDSEPDDILWGDANVSGKVDVADVVAVRRYLVNAEKYPLTAQGMLNADVQSNGGGINAQDAVAIQKYVLGIVTELPV